MTSPDAFQISLTDSTGAKVTHVDPGPYTITGPRLLDPARLPPDRSGVDQATDVETTAQTTWNVTFTDGTYRFLCDAHPTVMRGSFTSGTVTTPPPVKKLVAQVGPKSAIILKTPAGARVKRLTAGAYSITVSDLTRSDNFHLIAPGANRKTRRQVPRNHDLEGHAQGRQGRVPIRRPQAPARQLLVVAASS